MSQDSDFTWAILWAGQCEFDVMQMFGKMALHAQFYGPTRVSPV